MTTQTKQLVEAANALIGDLINKRPHFDSFQNLCKILATFEQSDEEVETGKTATEIWKEWCEKDISWTDAAYGAMSEYTSQQTADKDRQLQVQQSHIDDQDQLIFEQDKEIADLKENINRLIEAHMGAEKEVSELKAEVERLRKRPIVYGAPTNKVNNH